MSTPTPGDVHVNAPLTGMSSLIAQDLSKFIADRAALNVPSKNQSNSYFTFDKAYWFRDEMKKRGPGAEAEQTGYGISTDSFHVDVWALKEMISDQLRANQDAPINGDRAAVKHLMLKDRIRREKSFASTFLASGVWTTAKAGSSDFVQWDDYAGSDPLEDVENWKEDMRLLTGHEPNVMVLDKPVWRKLKNHPSLINRVRGMGSNNEPAKVTMQAVASLFELDEILVMAAVENTAAEGATMVGAGFGGKKALLFHRPTAPGVETASALYTFTWPQFLGEASGIRIKRYREEPKASDTIEIESAFVHKVVAPDLGVYLSAVVA